MNSLLDPAILFFAVGVVAGLLKSDLEIPPQVAKFLSLYLLMALGLKGGFALAQSGFTAEVAGGIGAGLLMAVLVPGLGYLFLRRHVSRFDAAAVAASYGSVSAVTFVTTMQWLETQQIAFGGHMMVTLVLMESPAILMAVLIATSLRATGAGAGAGAGSRATTGSNLLHAGAATALAPSAPAAGMPVKKVLHESLTNGAHLLLIGSMLVGFLGGEAAQSTLKPFSGDLFKGMLSFFLLDMGLLVARNFASARAQSPLLVAYAATAPFVHAVLALGLAWPLGLQPGDATLLMVLSASASYIVVPAVLREAIPEANPALYFGLSLGITFPLNIVVGIPTYASWAQAVL